MKPRHLPEPPSLRWLHEIRSREYERKRALPPVEWFPPADATAAIKACRSMGLRVKAIAPSKAPKRKRA